MRKALYILGDLNDADVTWLAENGERRTVSAGTIIVEEGQPVTSLFIITDGSFEVILAQGSRVAELGSGDIVGEMSLIEKRPPSVSVRAVSDGTVLAVPQETLRAELERNQGFSARFYRAIAVFLSDRLRSTVGQLGYGDVKAEDPQEAFVAEHELDDGLLDTLHVAGDRMRRLISILDGRRD